MRLRIALIITAVFCVNFCPAGQDKKQYCYKFEKGQQYYIKHILQRKIKPIESQGDGMTIEQKFSFGYKVLVKDVAEDGSAWLQCMYDYVSIDQKDFEKQVSYDSVTSDNDSVSPLLWGYRALLGEVFEIKISKLGKVEQVKGFLDVHHSIGEKIQPNPKKKMLIRQIQSQFNDFAMRELLTNLTDIYTDKNVSKGTSWNKTFETSYDSQMVFDNKFRINDVTDDGFAVIGLESKIKTKFGAKPINRNLMKLKSKSSGSQNGTIKINESSGEIITSDINQKITTFTEVISSEAQIPKSSSVEIESLIHFEFKKLSEQKPEEPIKSPENPVL